MKTNQKYIEIIKMSLFFVVSLVIGGLSQAYLLYLEAAELGNSLEESVFIRNAFHMRESYILACLVCIGIVLLYYKGEVLGRTLYRYRFWIAGVLFVFCVIMEIHGSSIGMWARTLGSLETGEIAGISRSIRSDEWAISTPMMLSQYYQAEPFSYFSESLRGIPTDMFIVYGQPVLDTAILFRPFHWGYLFLSPGKGLAFYWCGRFIALFLVSFEMMMFLTNRRKRLSLAGAVFIVFSPVVQWWFAINGFVEMLIFAQLSILLLNQYMQTEKVWIRSICAGVIAICAGGFILTMYPAWQVPMAYLILILGIGVIVKNRKSFRFRKSDIIILAVTFFIFTGNMAHILWKSKDTIAAVLNTVYPGKRVDIGGGAFSFILNYPSNIWYAMFGRGTMSNVCESAQFIDFFPLCYMLPVYVLVKKRGKDLITVLLLGMSILLFCWSIIGFPEILAKITLFSYSTGIRAYTILGFCNVLLLFRALSFTELYKMSTGKVVVSGVVLGSVVVIGGKVVFPDFYPDIRYYVVTILAFIGLFTLLLFAANKKYQTCFILFSSCVMIYAGAFVNPICHGIEVVYAQEEVQEIQTLYEKNKTALWAMESLGPPYNNLAIMTGASTVNSTNAYPAMEHWHKIDSSKQYEDVYNRYAFVILQLKEEGDAEFILNAPDVFTVILTAEDLKKLDVDYIFTARNDLAQYSNEDVELVQMKTVDRFFIYQIK